MKVRRFLNKAVRNSQLLITIGLLMLFIILAALQYVWLGQLSEGEREQMRSHLNGVATRFRDDFDAELMRTMGAFDAGFERRANSAQMTRPDEYSTFETFLERYARWKRAAQHPNLVSGINLAIGDKDGNLTLYKLSNDKLSFDAIDWPSDLIALKSDLTDQVRRSRNPASVPERRFPEGPNAGTIEHPPSLLVRIPLNEFRTVPDGPLRPPPGQPPPLSGFAIITLDLNVITEEIFPELVQRNFGPSDSSSYELTIISRSAPTRVLFQHPKHADAIPSNAPDVKAGIFSLAPARGPGPGPRRGPPMRPPQPPGLGPSDGRGPGPGPGPRGFRPGQDPGLWEIQLRHHAGSLEAAVAQLRKRSLIVSFSILGLLAASVAMLIASARRSRRLARQQMDFVAGVSHELRTPLSVIETAAYNLDKGIVRTEHQTRAYGAMIGKESSRLKRMVEQMLEYAGVEAGRVDYALDATGIDQIIEEAVASSAPLIAEGGFTLERTIESGIPSVMADAPALARALENLISNAMKYGGEDKWIGIRAFAESSQVTIEVADHGIGIPQDEAAHIFEPFFRGNEARSRQIRGNGLGLSLVKHIVTAHGGTIRVQSAPQKGTKFILSLPVSGQESTRERPVISISDYEQTNSAG